MNIWIIQKAMHDFWLENVSCYLKESASYIQLKTFSSSNHMTGCDPLNHLQLPKFFVSLRLET